MESSSVLDKNLEIISYGTLLRKITRSLIQLNRLAEYQNESLLFAHHNFVN